MGKTYTISHAPIGTKAMAMAEEILQCIQELQLPSLKKFQPFLRFPPITIGNLVQKYIFQHSLVSLMST